MITDPVPSVPARRVARDVIAVILMVVGIASLILLAFRFAPDLGFASMALTVLIMGALLGRA